MITRKSTSNITLFFAFIMICGLIIVILVFCQNHKRHKKVIIYPEEFFQAVEEGDSLRVERVSEKYIYLEYNHKRNHK